MNNNLQGIADQLAQAKSPEDVFGEIKGREDEKQAALKAVYYRLAKLTHPDAFLETEDQRLASIAFSRLTEWYAQAQAKLNAGIYASSRVKLVMDTGRRSYSVYSDGREGLVSNAYPCTFWENGRLVSAVLKMVRQPQDNDLAQNEVEILQRLKAGRGAKKFGPYLPELIDAFLYEQAGVQRHVSVFAREEGWYSLEEVRSAYPDGIDPRDMAWMWRRLLVVLGYIHNNGVIHGAVLPKNILIQPEAHGLMLEEFAFAVSDFAVSGTWIPAVDLAYRRWYPQEVFAKESPLPGTDIGMAAYCMAYLLGGDLKRNFWPERVPQFIRSFLKGSSLPGKNARPQDAWDLKEEFDQLLERHWGARKFHPFSMKLKRS